MGKYADKLKQRIIAKRAGTHVINSKNIDLSGLSGTTNSVLNKNNIDLSVLSPPPQSILNKRKLITLVDVLAGTQFNEAMVNDGVARFMQPFDEHDICDIEEGRLSREQVSGYLDLWITQNDELFKILKDLQPAQQDISEAFNITDELAMQGISSPRGDYLYITKKLANYPLSKKREILKTYAAAWLDACIDEPVTSKKANAGRRTANIWLRTENFLSDNAHRPTR